ncbi:MAG: hypothetical protein LBL94_06510 [Prevotellaceae bacterium]|jgi:hypothetical protein|nr:hypothetical protein [Prevotellaceae bacterium]
MSVNTTTAISVLPLHIRIDRNIVHNADSLFDLFGMEGDNMDDNLLRSLLYYLCYSYQQNLFSYNVIEVCDFAEVMGYSPTFLRTRHPHPLFAEEMQRWPAEQRKSYLDSGYCTYATNFENALYALYKKEVYLIYGGKFYNKTDKEQKFTANENVRMVVLRSLRQITVRSGRTHQEKKVYPVELDDRFIHSLTKYFIRGNRNMLVALRKSKLDIMYLKLLQQREHAMFANTPCVQLENFGTLCRWAGVPVLKKDGGAVPAKKRKQLLMAALERLRAETDLGFTYTVSASRGQRWPYTFTLQFEVGQKAQEKHKEAARQDMDHIFLECIQRELFSLWRELKCGGANPLCVSMDEFYGWMATDCDKEEKKQAYMLTCTKVYGKETPSRFHMFSRDGNFERFYAEALKQQQFITPMIDMSQPESHT